ncbi:DUF3445 domain-containing protein [Roseovarius sp. SCSIO 43702]|uniref:heme-dependent oxidative N-demethylase family protein n=1 Tax=Roseovarius sp. SCSIO 43702 TaxID=2823043 RepID=UPI001C72C44B|nr:DUF3445 domain-containing protein [Roseovarius sp. SCSIO 43702]QYX56747.1 DUF3445 domain-containing protein [Roseovarius sp. SCSIO 43702]
MPEILQDALPAEARDRPRLPGVSPVAMADWIVTDEAFAAQMALRERLVSERRDVVIDLLSEGRAAADELLRVVLGQLSEHPGYAVEHARVTRPDGVTVQVDESDPLGTLGRLVQEDFCILRKQGAEHVLVGGVLCFPSSWRLADKIGRPLVAIHAPVAEYDADIARRVQRLFDGVRAGRPLVRQNLLHYATPELHQPGGKAPLPEGPPPYLRSERQCVLRLPETGAVVFSIHTWVTRAEP